MPTLCLLARSMLFDSYSKCHENNILSCKTTLICAKWIFAELKFRKARHVQNSISTLSQKKTVMNKFHNFGKAIIAHDISLKHKLCLTMKP